MWYLLSKLFAFNPRTLHNVTTWWHQKSKNLCFRMRMMDAYQQITKNISVILWLWRWIISPVELHTKPAKTLSEGVLPFKHVFLRNVCLSVWHHNIHFYSGPVFVVNVSSNPKGYNRLIALSILLFIHNVINFCLHKLGVVITEF